MGQSAFAKCMTLADLATIVFNESGSTNVQDVIAKIQKHDASIASSWNVDTINRYINVGKKLSADQDLKNLMFMWDYIMQRNGAFDGITALRALSQCLGLCCSMCMFVSP